MQRVYNDVEMYVLLKQGKFHFRAKKQQRLGA